MSCDGRVVKIYNLQLKEHLHTVNRQITETEGGDMEPGSGGWRLVTSLGGCTASQKCSQDRYTVHYLIQDSYYTPPNWDHHIEHASYP